LGAGINWLKERGLDELRAHEVELVKHLREGLRNIKGVRLYGVDDPELSTAVVSFTLEGRRVSEVGYRLDEEFEIFCRVGLHCAPAAHRSIGTFPEGTVRLAPGATTTLAEIESTVRAVERIAAS
jgi:selenocysteine lyase/cysteine desulfurase